MVQMILVLAFAFVSSIVLSRETVHVKQNERDSTAAFVTFQQHVAPLLKANCSPCHFEGGQVYDDYPFDEYATVKKLGEKLNTRLKEDKQKSLINNWLKSGAREK